MVCKIDQILVFFKYSFIFDISALASLLKVMDDMKKMKSSHVKVIDRIQDQYTALEDDIQVFTAMNAVTIWPSTYSNVNLLSEHVLQELSSRVKYCHV